MGEPVTTAATIGGMKMAHISAGAAGGVVGLLVSKTMAKGQMATLFIVGVISAAFVTPLASSIIKIVFGQMSIEAENGIAFILGSSAMYIMAGIVKSAGNFMNNPSKFIRTKGGIKDDDAA